MTTPNWIPFSKANVATLIDNEKVMGVANAASTTSKQLAFDSNALSRQQTLTQNVELRGTRKQGTWVIGPKNPAGALSGHMTSQGIVLFYEAMLGKRQTTELGATGIVLTVTQSATLGSTPPESGAHSYVVVVSKGGNGTAKRTLHSALDTVLATITADGTHKVHIARSGGTLPTGWTWALYRTAAADDPSDVTKYKLVSGTIALAASVVSFDDDTADSTLGSAVPTASDTSYADYLHVITVGDSLPTYSIQRSLPYVGAGDATQYTLGLGCAVEDGTVAMKSTGYFDFGGNWLAMSVETMDSSFASSSPGDIADWREGEKLHHAMIGAGRVKVGTYGSLSEFLAFLDFTFKHANNLDKSDFPLGLQGNRGSIVPALAETTVSGTMKVSNPDVLALLHSAPGLQVINVQHDFATYGHYILHEFLACQFDPADPATTGQGIQTATFNAHGVTDPNTTEQVRVTIVNGEPTASYDAPS